MSRPVAGGGQQEGDTIRYLLSTLTATIPGCEMFIHIHVYINIHVNVTTRIYKRAEVPAQVI